MFPLFKSPLYISPPSLKVERTNVPLFSARIALRPFFTTPNIFVSFKSENLNDVKNRWSQLKLSSRTAELNKQWWHCWEWQSIGLAMCSQCLLKTWAICWLARPVKREVSDERKGGSDPPNNLSVSLTINKAQVYGILFSIFYHYFIDRMFKGDFNPFYLWKCKEISQR